MYVGSGVCAYACMCESTEHLLHIQCNDLGLTGPVVVDVSFESLTVYSTYSHLRKQENVSNKSGTKKIGII